MAGQRPAVVNRTRSVQRCKQDSTCYARCQVGLITDQEPQGRRARVRASRYWSCRLGSRRTSGPSNRFAGTTGRDRQHLCAARRQVAKLVGQVMRESWRCHEVGPLTKARTDGAGMPKRIRLGRRGLRIPAPTTPGLGGMRADRSTGRGARSAIERGRRGPVSVGALRVEPRPRTLGTFAVRAGEPGYRKRDVPSRGDWRLAGVHYPVGVGPDVPVRFPVRFRATPRCEGRRFKSCHPVFRV